MKDQRLSCAPALRNREAIAETLKGVLPHTGLVLEIGSGTGQHCLLFAERFPKLTFQPTERDQDKIDSINAWQEEGQCANMRPACRFDVTKDTPPVKDADALLTINVIHIAPWETTKALFKLARQVLSAGAPLIFYGPFHRSDQKTAETNLAFDAQLRATRPDFGIRHVDDLSALAHDHGLGLPLLIDMPVNNLCLVFRKT